jgi:hypothetical protein
MYNRGEKLQSLYQYQAGLGVPTRVTTTSCRRRAVTRRPDTRTNQQPTRLGRRAGITNLPTLRAAQAARLYADMLVWRLYAGLQHTFKVPRVRGGTAAKLSLARSRRGGWSALLHLRQRRPRSHPDWPKPGRADGAAAPRQRRMMV